MDFRLDDTLEAMKLNVRNIVKNECLPLEKQYLSTPPETYSYGGKELPGGLAEERLSFGNLPLDEWKRLEKISKEAGIFTMHVPEEYGGGGTGALGHIVVDEEVRRSIVGLPIAEVPVMMYGSSTQEQVDRYILPCVRGEQGYAFAQTEPQAGSDPGGMMQTRAIPDGSDWVLDGTKMFCTGGGTADFLLVQAVTDTNKRQHGGVTMFIVDKDISGLSFAPIQTWIYPGKAHQYFVYLDGVRIPKENILGEIGQGFLLGQKWLVHQDRLLRGSMALGIMTRALEMAVDWATTRITFGKPIADRQAIQWMLTDVYVDIMALRDMTRHTAWRADRGEDVRVECSMIKYCAGEWGWRSIDKIMQIFGGLGETMDMPIPHWYHSLRHARVGGGTSEIHKFVMARGLLQGRIAWEG